MISQLDPIYFDQDYAIYHPKFNHLMQKDIEELTHFKSVVATFFNYSYDQQFEIIRLQQNFLKLTKDHQKILKNIYESRIDQLNHAISSNSIFAFLIAANYIDIFPQIDVTKVKHIKEIPYIQGTTQEDISKLKVTFKQFMRDWSKEGEVERNQCYKPLIEQLKNYYSEHKQMKYSVLVPGVGLGRLVFDLAVEGFSAQGNEFSYQMLLGSNFIMNVCQQKEQFIIYPFINNFCNHLSTNDAFKQIKVPDVELSLGDSQGDLSMVAGEFITVYKNQLQKWDSILTCFFLDTANNIIDYIKTIWDILKNGGVWIHLGPLEFHYSKCLNELSIELAWSDIKELIQKQGFIIEYEEMRECTYNHEANSMKKLIYECKLMRAVKKIN